MYNYRIGGFTLQQLLLQLLVLFVVRVDGELAHSVLFTNKIK